MEAAACGGSDWAGETAASGGRVGGSAGEEETGPGRQQPLKAGPERQQLGRGASDLWRKGWR